VETVDQTIVGRDEELKILEEVYESSEPQFLAVYGRRRIGKTYLISEFFKPKGTYFEITGMQEGSLKEQLFRFAYEFSRQFNEDTPIAPPQSWTHALILLHQAIEKVEEGRKIILFFDEIPWLASRRSGFLSALEHLWNRYLSRRANLILVICGSSASWVIKNVINNRGGLYGRVTKKMCLLPFTLAETEKYLRSRRIDLDRKQIIDLYMAIGGVPKYLSYVQGEKSAAQTINALCFSLKGELHHEFHNLYRSLFTNHEYHIAIVRALAKTSGGLSREELLKQAKLSSGGSSSRTIEELIDAGFLIYVPSFHQKKKGGTYRLIDEYSLFYLTWMEHLSQISMENGDADFWMKKYGSSQWKAWSGCAFESLCFKHIQNIKKALGIAGISTLQSGWRYLPKPSADQDQGAQIDLVIDRADRCINLCEMKFSDSEFVIDKSYGEKLKAKKRIFKDQTKTKKALFTTLVTSYGVKKNGHSLGIVDAQLTMDALFE
jgi:predicted AAA+ superfamily ATPase